MPRIVVTAGRDYLDIDAYGGIVAYGELLQCLGQASVAISTAPTNGSVTQPLKQMAVSLETRYTAEDNDSFVVIDLSDPDFFDGFVTAENVITVIDHHAGFEQYWSEKIGPEARIEFVGAACTLVYEAWQEAKVADKMSKQSATLLAAGIIDNTLNFKAQLTTDRDRDAYAWLAEHAKLSPSWAHQYLEDCQAELLSDLRTNLINDTKHIAYPGDSEKTTIGQIAVLDAKTFLDEYSTEITNVLSDGTSKWYLNLLNLTSGQSYFYTNDTATKLWLQKLLGVTFSEDLAVAKTLWLRKEIYKKALDEENSSK